ncbi:hypothetical protein ACFL6S_32760, partial [Candidatus Poribacteria bacterium]
KEIPGIPPLEHGTAEIPVIPMSDKCVDTGSNSGRIPEDEQRMLVDVATYPVSGVAERYRRLSLSSSRGCGIRRKLTDRGLIRSQRISTGKGSATILFLTDSGTQALRRLGHDVPDPPETKRYGGDKHRFWIGKIAQLLEEKGYYVKTEHPIGAGRTIDIAAFMDDWKVAVEVETGSSDVVSNVRKALAAEFHRVISVLPDKTSVDSLLSELKRLDVDLEKVHVVAYGDIENSVD